MINEKLQQHAQTILDQAQALSDNTSPPLNEGQQKYIGRIQRNTTELMDVYSRLRQMPIRDVMSCLNHDIRNLITPIVGYAELLDMQVVGPLTEQQRNEVRSICRTARELGDVLDSTLESLRKEHNPESEPL